MKVIAKWQLAEDWSCLTADGEERVTSGNIKLPLPAEVEQVCRSYRSNANRMPIAWNGVLEAIILINMISYYVNKTVYRVYAKKKQNSK